MRQLAHEIARVTEGHPLAIVLLAGEFDTSDVAPADFLKNWADELAHARRPGLAPHQVTFATAFERSYNRLSPDDQRRLRMLSVFTFPFFAEGAALVWTEDGGRRTEDGRRRTEDERRRTEDERRRTEDERRRKEDDRALPPADRLLPTDDRRPTTDDRRPTTANRALPPANRLPPTELLGG